MSAAISPLAPAGFPALPLLPGVRLAACAAHIRYAGRDDLMLAELAPGSTVAGVLTRSLTAGAPVLWCRECLAGGAVRAIVVNSGNANVFTGRAGREAVEATAAAAARLLGGAQREVFVSSTGVIGEKLPADKLVAALPRAVERLSAEAWEPAARAIMTTDTFPKGAAATAEIDGVEVHLNGFAKGSGMIAPDMATMLAYVFTDAALPHEVLRPLLAEAADHSFNSITVDGDTSTSDTLLLCATGQARHRAVTSATDPRLAGFRAALGRVTVDLAQQVVRDGEGAQKFVAINVTGAESVRAARRYRPHDRQFAPGQDRTRRRRRQLGAHRHGGGPRRRKGRSRPSLDRGRRHRDRRPRRAGPRLRRGAGRSTHEGPRDRDRGRSRHRLRPRHGVDLRSDPRLYRHQWQLPQLICRRFCRLMSRLGRA